MTTLTRRATLAGAATTVAAAATTLRGRAARAEPIVYKFAHGFPETHPVHTHTVAAAEQVKERSKGALTIDIFSNGAFGGDSQLLSQLRSNAVQFFPTGGLVFSTLVPVAAINGMGFAFADYDAVWRAMDGGLGTHIRAGFDKVGLRPFARCWDNGFRQISSSTHPITSPADLHGFKIRVPVSPLYTSLFTALGCGVTSINLPEVYSALQTHLVDGQENPMVMLETTRFYEVQKYVSLTNHVWDGIWVVANKQAMESLSPELRGIVDDAFNDQAGPQRAEVAKLNASLVDEMKAKGLAVNTTTPDAFRAVLREAGFYRTWRDKFGAEGWGELESAVGKLA
jgi:tripartite ATP-independent transporter DctP family solute receptor